MTFRYPRRTLLRSILRVLGRFLLRLLTRVTVNGMENMPAKGPVILVGNHNGMIEAILMALYPPYNVEILATGEIPLDPRYGWVAHLYGIIPIQRGAMDRGALNSALQVLQQGGVVAIFPEGGIWEDGARKGKTGVSWLSHQAQAPLVPIGFGGVRGALAAAFSLKRPPLTMNVGHLIPAVNAEVEGKARKTALEEAAAMIMARVDDLIPEDEKKRMTRIYDERFELQLAVTKGTGEDLALPENLALTEAEMLTKFFHRPIILDVFRRNLKLPVRPLQELEPDPEHLSTAIDASLEYLKVNPYFLSYRFGYDESTRMQLGLKQLRAICHWAREKGAAVHIRPIRRFRQRGRDGEFIQDRPGMAPAV